MDTAPHGDPRQRINDLLALAGGALRRAIGEVVPAQGLDALGHALAHPVPAGRHDVELAGRPLRAGLLEGVDPSSRGVYPPGDLDGVVGRHVPGHHGGANLEVQPAAAGREMGYDQKQSLSAFLREQGFRAEFYKDLAQFDRGFVARNLNRS